MKQTRQTIENNFEAISNSVNNSDKQSKLYCNGNGIDTTEVYETDKYIFKYKFASNTDKNIRVKTKHRVILTTVDGENKILPSHLDMEKAS